MARERLQKMEADTTVKLGGVNSKTRKPNPTKAEGFYVGTRTGLKNKFNPDKPNSMHILDTPKGKLGVWGQADLDNQMKRITPGVYVWIEQKGEQDVGLGNPKKLYIIDQDKENTIEVQSSDVGDFGAEEDSGNYASDEQSFDGGEEETGLDEEEAQPDEVVPQRAAAPKHTATAPDAARQAKVKALLNRSKATA